MREIVQQSKEGLLKVFNRNMFNSGNFVIKNSVREIGEVTLSKIANKLNVVYIIFYFFMCVRGVLNVFTIEDSYLSGLLETSMLCIYCVIILYCLYEVVEDYIFIHFVRYIMERVGIIC